MKMRRVLVLVAGVALGFAAISVGAGPLATAHAAHASLGERALSNDPTVTVYGATWCSACKQLEKGLRDRGVPFDLVDVDQNPRSYDVAKRATGKNVVPITSVARRDDDVVWVVGSDVDAVEKAYRGE